MAYFLYDLATTVLAPFGGAWLCVSSKHRPLLGRFAPRVPGLSGRPVWVQACSVGEVSTAKAVVAAMRRRWPGVPVLLTTSTVTGRALAESVSSDAAVAWFPFDHPLSMRGFLRRVRPRALVLIETELWPNALRQTHRFGVPSVVVNGRLSDKHFARYRRYRRFVTPMLTHLTAAGMQNQEYAGRLAALGVDPDVIRVTGNTKFDGVATEVSAETCRSVRIENGFVEDQPVLVFGSTRPGDEALAAKCWKALRDEFSELKLIVAPRHLNRVKEATEPFDEPLLRRSEVQQGRRPEGERVFVLDTTGELAAFYAIATVAVIGGSFYPGVNGHNPLEPAGVGVPTVFGPYMSNFVDPARVLVENRGARQVTGPRALLDELRGLLSDASARRELGRKGRKAIIENRGAIDRNLDLVEQVVDLGVGG